MDHISGGALRRLMLQGIGQYVAADKCLGVGKTGAVKRRLLCCGLCDVVLEHLSYHNEGALFCAMPASTDRFVASPPLPPAELEYRALKEIWNLFSKPIGFKSREDYWDRWSIMKKGGPILQVKNISKNFGTVRALGDISFDLKGGKILGLVGDNGAGKSTLLKILSGGLRPSGGEIYLEGKETRFKSPADAMKKGIAIVYQFLQLVDIAKVWENFFMGRELTKRIGPLAILDVEKMKHLAGEAIAKYGHTLNIEREMRELSGGQRQIIAVTRAIEANPAILLLDEPTQGLSKRVINEIFDLLRKTKEEKNISIIITSQWYEQISDFIDDVMVFRRGEIVGHFDAESANGVKIFKLAMGLTS